MDFTWHKLKIGNRTIWTLIEHNNGIAIRRLATVQSLGGKWHWLAGFPGKIRRGEAGSVRGAMEEAVRALELLEVPPGIVA